MPTGPSPPRAHPVLAPSGGRPRPARATPSVAAVAPDLLASVAVVGGRLCTDLVDVTSDLAALDGEGFWAVVVPYDGTPVCARFATVRPAVPWPGAPWAGPAVDAWTSSLDEAAFSVGVTSIRDAIAAGDVYQVNLTRRLRAPLPEGPDVRIEALGGGESRVVLPV